MDDFEVLVAMVAAVISLDDLLGHQRLSKLEQTWRASARRTFATWLAAIERSLSSMLMLLVASIAMIVFGAMIIGSAYVWFGGGAYEWFSHHHSVIIIILAVTFAGAIGGAGEFARLFVIATRGILLLPEMAIARKALAAIAQTGSVQSPPSESTIASEGRFAGSAIITLLVALSIPIITMTALAVRLVIVVIYAVVWCLVFAPSIVLNKIAERTGAEHYVTIGKYVLVVIAAVIAVLRRMHRP